MDMFRAYTCSMHSEHLYSIYHPDVALCNPLYTRWITIQTFKYANLYNQSFCPAEKLLLLHPGSRKNMLTSKRVLRCSWQSLQSGDLSTCSWMPQEKGLAVNRKVGGLSPPRDEYLFLRHPKAHWKKRHASNHFGFEAPEHKDKT